MSVELDVFICSSTLKSVHSSVIRRNDIGPSPLPKRIRAASFAATSSSVTPIGLFRSSNRAVRTDIWPRICCNSARWLNNSSVSCCDEKSRVAIATATVSVGPSIGTSSISSTASSSSVRAASSIAPPKVFPALAASVSAFSASKAPACSSARVNAVLSSSICASRPAARVLSESYRDCESSRSAVTSMSSVCVTVRRSVTASISTRSTSMDDFNESRSAARVCMSASVCFLVSKSAFAASADRTICAFKASLAFASVALASYSSARLACSTASA
mmetsp:Transcript_426/g.1472  ORF Transcript_426/g.1472 Transcript_426/m.1472 type:complete len:275 (-) Transcript_426:732-1556(-)